MGSKRLGEQLKQQLEAQGKKPYVIPVGGSDATGTFGYLVATQEILEQAGKGSFTDIVNVYPSNLLFHGGFLSACYHVGYQRTVLQSGLPPGMGARECVRRCSHKVRMCKCI